MGCSGCSTTGGGCGSADKAGGCGSNGGCSTGGCNRKNTYDWIAALGVDDPTPYPFVEVSFKNGSRKEFFKNPNHTKANTGDFVLVETPKGGYDLGKISLSGELVRLQMKKRRVKNDARLQSVIRKAHERDMERLDEVRNRERDTLVQARAIARSLNLNMKIGDIEYQGDGKKVTIFYTSDNRVDFRELIRLYHRDFQVKIEMRQIGARQESARIGGLGNCGRELCCSTWLSDFKSVNTAAARYQNLAINQIKLTGMCGRLKCCLNYELDAYIDALEEFPDRAERFKTAEGNAILVKTDVFKRLMFYTYENNRGKFYPLLVDQVWDVLDMIKSGKIPQSLAEIESLRLKETEEEEEVIDFENVHNVIELPFEVSKRKKKKKRKSGVNLKSALEDGAEGRSGGQQSRGGENQRQGTPQNRPQNRPQQGQPRQEGGQNRPPRPEGGNQNRPPRPERDGQNRPPRPEGEGQNRPPRPEGGNQNRPPRPERDGQNRPPRPEGEGQNRPPRSEQGAPRPDRNEPRDPNQPRPPREPRPDQENRPPRQEGTPPTGDQQPRTDQPRNDRSRGNRNRNRNRGNNRNDNQKDDKQ